MQLHAVPPSMAPIVVADHGEALDILRTSLPATRPLVAADSLAQARRLITADTPLVLCDCHFDDGRMYDLLRWLKTSGLAAVPFLAIRVREGELDDAMYESVQIATGALGGNGFIDLYRWQLRYGAAEAARRLTQQIEALALGAPGSMPPG
jgi:CheY-like chemotaxis protein